MSQVTIVMTLYYPSTKYGRTRRDIMYKTLASWFKHLKFDGEIRVHFADDGSKTTTEMAVARIYHPDRYWKVSYSRQERHGCGASLNAGFRQAFENGSDVVLYAVDDWELMQDFDITPWVKLLEERQDVGMVRLGPPHPNTMGKVEIFTDDYQGWGLRLFREGYAYGMRPALYHKRFIDAYGWFEEDISTLECERLYNEKFCSMNGPDIVLALPVVWYHHISGLSDIDPRTENEPRSY